MKMISVRANLSGVGPEERIIEITNSSIEAVDVLLFGGVPYTEPIVAEGSFVMKSKAEIALAYKDFYEGKYGELTSSPS